jgi:RNA polymerase sigma-70 factor (sigma-E family)
MAATREPTSARDGAGVVMSRGAGRDRMVEALFDRSYEAMCRLAYVILGDPHTAEEIVMEAMLQTFSGWGRIRNPDSADVYLKRAVVNLCRSRIRRAAIEARVDAAVRRGPRPAGKGDQDARETSFVVWDAVRSLPARQRACVVLRYLEDMTEGQIAEVLDCSVGTVKSQLSKARRRLAGSLGEVRERA